MPGGLALKTCNRRDFLKKSGTGLMAAAASSLMTDLVFNGRAVAAPSSLFQDRFGVSAGDMKKILSIALSKGGDFSELYLEYRISNSVRMEEEIIKESSENVSLGAGVRVLKGDQTGYGYTSDLSFDKMKETALIAAAIASSGARVPAAAWKSAPAPAQHYDMKRPLSGAAMAVKIDMVRQAYAAAQQFDRRITKIQSSLSDEIQHVTVANSEGLLASDTRPQVRLSVRATAEEGDKRNSGFFSGGGRVGLSYFEVERTPSEIGKKAAEEAVALLSAVDPPAGEQPVVLDSGQSGVMIHEAVGHPLEADGNRKKTSIMWDKLGKTVACPLVTIFDDPTLPGARGSLNVDDEGTVPRNTVLIEKGRLVGYLQDRLSAGLMHMESNGHGRRESYENNPIPRMANTCLARGESDPGDIIRSVKKGFFAVSYQGGMVQDTGKFTFSVNMGYLIEDGKLTRPVKNATLIGTNVQILNEIEMVGNDMGFFLGTCGKDGQSAAVSAGTPTLKIRQMTVGGRQ
jgi:TldD protein